MEQLDEDDEYEKKRDWATGTGRLPCLRSEGLLKRQPQTARAGAAFQYNIDHCRATFDDRTAGRVHLGVPEPIWHLGRES